MQSNILKIEIRIEHDVVLARQRARQISALLGYEVQDQVRIATAVSEIARNVYRYAKPGMIEFTVTDAAPFSLEIRINDKGPGIEDLTAVLEGRYVSHTGMGMGITGARKLMDDFQIQSSPAGTSVILRKTLPRRTLPLNSATFLHIAEQLARQPPQDPFEELQRQNQELLSTLHEVQRQKTELAQLNRELEDTNRGVVARLRKEVKSVEGLGDEVWTLTLLLDGLGLFVTEAFRKGREEVISRQQHEMLELSTPVVKLWDGVLALPLIGTLDSARTQVVMEALLQRIVETGSEVAIIDITGVPTVDTLVAQHLLKTITAARLMGAECIISGIRPQIAQTIVHLGVSLTNVVTKSTLADAFKIALQRTGVSMNTALTPTT